MEPAARPEAYNPRTGTYGATRQGAGVYGSWGQTGVQRGDDWGNDLAGDQSGPPA